MRELREREARWVPSPDGLNFSHWWRLFTVINPAIPFPSVAWNLPYPPPHENFRTDLFHDELPLSSIAACQMITTGSLAQYHASIIQSCVDQEFKRLFVQAKAVDTYSAPARDLWRVLHYCNLPCNAVRTEKGEAISRLLRSETYDDISMDSLRWLAKNHFDRHHMSALRLIPVIIENCIFRSEVNHGLQGVAPPVPST
jgi:hypothetical protein